jgi:pilus assembly protein CpaB
MSIRTVLVGVFALAFGLAAAVGIQMALQAPPPPTPTETVPVVVAAFDIPRFTTMTLDLLRVQQVPKDLVPEGAINQPEEALDRGCITFIAEGEAVLQSKLSAKGVRGLAVAIPRGMRAVSIRTADVTTPVGGFALPGSKVDVLLTVRGNGMNDPTGGGTTLTLLQQVEVLAVDQRVETPANQKVDVTEMRSVTLLVTPEQATKLELGQTLGLLHLSLRNPLDTSVAENALVSMKDFRLPEAAAPDVPPQRALPGEKEPPPAPPKPPPPPPAPPPILSLRGSQGSWTRMP